MLFEDNAGAPLIDITGCEWNTGTDFTQHDKLCGANVTLLWLMDTEITEKNARPRVIPRRA